MNPAENVPVNAVGSRRSWSRPSVRRLATSAAEEAGTTDVDGVELLS